MAKKTSKPAQKRGPYKRKLWRDRIIPLLAKGETVPTAADMCGVSPRTVYLARQTDPAFESSCDAAENEYIDRLERVVRRRAEHGVEEPVFKDGRLQFTYITEKGSYVPDDVIDDLDKGPDGKPKIPRGWKRIPLTIAKPSDQLALALLRARNPKQFGLKAQAAVKKEGFKEEPVLLVVNPPEEIDGA